MARPQLKDLFLVDALKAAKKGTVINMHVFLPVEDIPNKALRQIEEDLKKSRSKLKKYKLIRYKKAGDIGPGKFRVRFDFVVS